MSLRKLLQEKKVTAYRLSKLTGISQSRIYAVMDSDLKKMSYENLEKIALALDINIEDLINHKRRD